MATPTEAIQALREEVKILTTQMGNQQKQLELLHPLTLDSTDLKRQVASLTKEVEQLRETAKEVPVLKHQIAELAKAKDTWGNRIWLIATISLSAFFATLTAILGALLTFTLNAKK